ncbi:MAG TPA: HAD family hydrolase [Longimicrobium sp.]|nr:HAD family hydrolase [Longimicrobium sp.]
MSDAPGRPAVFLDRDGTLIVDRHYLDDPNGVTLLPGAAAAVARLNRAGIAAVLITNQSGIGRGRFTEERYRAVHARLVELLAAEGARLDGEYHSPHAPGDADPEGLRKPGVGMFLRAAAEGGYDLARSFYVGDRLRDVIPAARLGGVAILARSAQSEIEEASALPFITVVESVTEAVELILGRGED